MSVISIPTEGGLNQSKTIRGGPVCILFTRIKFLVIFCGLFLVSCTFYNFHFACRTFPIVYLRAMCIKLAVGGCCGVL